MSYRYFSFVLQSNHSRIVLLRWDDSEFWKEYIAQHVPANKDDVMKMEQ
jgi:hypothetical protein